MATTAATGAALDRLAALPGVSQAVERAREACTALRWHPAMRSHADQARAEATVRAAACSAALDGARLPLRLVRDSVVGRAHLPQDPTGSAVHAVVRAYLHAARLGTSWRRTPHQVLAGLHVAAAAGLLPDEALGRPRATGEPSLERAPSGTPSDDSVGGDVGERLAAVADLLAAPATAPVLLVAALAHAEIVVVRPFVAGNPTVARALARAVAVGGGLDPTGVAVWEAGWLSAGPGYPAALEAYATGGADGVGAWLVAAAEALVAGAAEGTAVCDAVLAGRLPQ